MVNVVWVVIGLAIFAALGWGLAATFAARWKAADRENERLRAENEDLKVKYEVAKVTLRNVLLNQETERELEQRTG